MIGTSGTCTTSMRMPEPLVLQPRSNREAPALVRDVRAADRLESDSSAVTDASLRGVCAGSQVAPVRGG